ncbi:sulfotransferase family 2 domain-containing protein [Legionella pneumophila]|uniref:sulfotransferase family 2 domain-containing protein n=1 Tax=Legionella pneumophila TaxID=446 RepID=UPI0010102091|nr:sulfotransferase family 2 domain-containing protein [Legionella pneumophila]HAT9646184.1 hypothetical protein [Legionella pneumophila subsp. pneumophila]MCK1887577.1 sulfotransferase family protein [Legionella pneumophila]MCW8406534.1 sulfotransferase family protein [Legionella pneumophila]RYB35688.1 hypothetical protein D7235_10840 [Legionella pneumophila]RYB42961.1 hypothetical protein D7237_12885 [Legionella pneumophila]
MNTNLEFDWLSMSDSKFFFVHIPKTAGTSFRKSLESFFGFNRIMYDYSPSSVETSEVIIRYFYKKNSDTYNFFKEIQDIKAVSGHVPIMKYLPFFGISQTMTFVRNPLEQMISHYLHYMQHNGFQGTLQQFIKNPGIYDCQALMLRHVPLELIGFIGLTEHYDRSVKLINHQYQLNLETLHLNQTPSGFTIDPDAINDIQSLIAHEQQLYNKAKKIFKERSRMFHASQPWVYGCSAINHNNIVHGLAYFSNCDAPVPLDIYMEEEYLGSTQACKFSKNWAFLGLPRASFVGYEFQLPKNTKAGQEVKVIVRNTGQCISYDKLKTKKMVSV